MRLLLFSLWLNLAVEINALIGGNTQRESQISSTTHFSAINDNRREVLIKSAVAATGGVLWTPPNAHAQSTIPTTQVPKISLGSSNLQISRTIQGYWREWIEYSYPLNSAQTLTLY